MIRVFGECLHCSIQFKEWAVLLWTPTCMKHWYSDIELKCQGPKGFIFVNVLTFFKFKSVYCKTFKGLKQMTKLKIYTIISHNNYLWTPERCFMMNNPVCKEQKKVVLSFLWVHLLFQIVYRRIIVNDIVFSTKCTCTCLIRYIIFSKFKSSPQASPIWNHALGIHLSTNFKSYIKTMFWL